MNPEIQRAKQFASAQYCTPSFDLRRIALNIPRWRLLAFSASVFSLGVCGVLGTILAPLFSTNFRNAFPNHTFTVSDTTSAKLLGNTITRKSDIATAIQPIMERNKAVTGNKCLKVVCDNTPEFVGANWETGGKFL